jgi:hypothetical protein
LERNPLDLSEADIVEMERLFDEEYALQTIMNEREEIPSEQLDLFDLERE